MYIPTSLTIPIGTIMRRKNEEPTTIKSKIISQKLIIILIDVLGIVM